MKENQRIVIGGGKRLDYNDLAKSIGMLTIIWGHIYYGRASSAFVYAFHIPLFFVLSGMVFDRSKYPSFGSFLKKKLNSLLIPYAVFSFLTWIIWVAYTMVTHANVESYMMPLLQTFIAQGSEGYLVHNVPLWFVMCLFTMEVMYYFIAGFKRIWITVLTVLMAVISYCLLNHCFFINFSIIPWSIDAAMLGIPFYAMGHWTVCKWGHQRMMDAINNHKSVSILCMILWGVVTCLISDYNGPISFGHTDMGVNVFTAYLGGITGVSMLLIFCMLLAGSIFNKPTIKWMNFLKWFGRNSFNAMVIHNPIKGFITVVVGVCFVCDSSAVNYNLLYSFVSFVITLICTVVGIVMINWIKMKFVRH